MKQFGEAGSALLLFAAFCVAISLVTAKANDNNPSRTTNIKQRMDPTEEALKIVNIILTEYSLKHPQLNLSLKYAKSANKEKVKVNNFTTLYVVSGTFRRDNGSDMSCVMKVYIDDPVDNIESLINCELVREYTIDITLTNVAVKEVPPNNVS